MPCPEYTYADDTRTKCIPYDVIYDELHNKLHIGKLLRPDLFCQNQENAHLCDTDKVVGPIMTSNTHHDPNDPLFFFTNREPISHDSYEFHKSRTSPVVNNSHIYMLFTQQNVDITQLGEYMDQVAMTQKQMQISEEQTLINSIMTDF